MKRFNPSPILRYLFSTEESWNSYTWNPEKKWFPETVKWLLWYGIAVGAAAMAATLLR